MAERYSLVTHGEETLLVDRRSPNPFGFPSVVGRLTSPALAIKVMVHLNKQQQEEDDHHAGPD